MNPLRTYTFAVITILLPVGVFLSCSEDRNAVNYDVHPVGWTDPHSEGFHGQAAITLEGQSCAQCHGSDFLGGESGVSCYQCHQYPHPYATAEPPSGHQQLIASLHWNLAECSNCHGTDFSGARTGISCRECHTSSRGPASCSTCHGMPPVDDATLPFGMPSGAAGAHAKHDAKGYACSECHPSVDGLSHTGPLPADISFSEASIANRPPYETNYIHIGEPFSGNSACATYCHSDARGGPPNRELTWHDTGISCRDCHDVPVQRPDHPVERQCHLCHTHVDPTSNYDIPDSIRFINPELHVNGVINVTFNP
jgi:hypothetical protein